MDFDAIPVARHLTIADGRDLVAITVAGQLHSKLPLRFGSSCLSDTQLIGGKARAQLLRRILGQPRATLLMGLRLNLIACGVHRGGQRRIRSIFLQLPDGRFAVQRRSLNMG